MFSFTGLTKEQSELMVSKYHVYMTSNGRISVAGLTENNVKYVAESIKNCVEARDWKSLKKFEISIIIQNDAKKKFQDKMIILNDIIMKRI